MKTEELIVRDLNRRRRALGRGLGSLRVHRELSTAGRRVRALPSVPQEEPLPEWVPDFAQDFVKRVWLKSRKTN